MVCMLGIKDCVKYLRAIWNHAEGMVHILGIKDCVKYAESNTQQLNYLIASKQAMLPLDNQLKTFYPINRITVCLMACTMGAEIVSVKGIRRPLYNKHFCETFHLIITIRSDEDLIG